MYNHYKNSQGCILGDDMGLGKTVQVSLITVVTLSTKYKSYVNVHILNRSN